MSGLSAFMCHVAHSWCGIGSLCHVALFRTGTQVYNSAVRDFDIGYIMGLIAAGGSFTADRRQPSLQVKLHARDPFPLRHLADSLGGRVYGPYRHQTRHYYTWLLRGSALKAAIPLFRAYLPESWKREQFQQWLDQHSDFFAPERSAAALPESFRGIEP